MGTHSQMATTLEISTHASSTNDFPACATKFFASSVSRVPCVALQPTSIILSLHPNVFSNARGPLTVRNRCRTPAIPWRANQNRSSNTQFCKNLATRPNFFVRSLVITVAIQFSRVVLRARHAFGVPGVRVPRQLFCGTAPPACLRHCDGVLAVLAGSSGVFLTGQKSLAHQNELPRQQGGPR
jgi:hypothetical protein